MNLVGIDSKGESVWLGFFLCDVLKEFAALARAQRDPDFARECANAAEGLSRNIEEHGWDGAWYRRAYFDDGTALGSASNAECRIDSISQSWSVLSGAGDPARSRIAMAAVDQHLVRREAMLSSSSSTRPSIHRTWIPATSAAMCPGCARTVVNTPMARCGPRWLSPPWGTASGPGRC